MSDLFLNTGKWDNTSTGAESMSLIRIKDLKHEYIRRDDNGDEIGRIPAVDGVDMDVAPGEFIAILGHNGSGKSTLAAHFNAMLFPTEGTVWVDGKDTKDTANLWDIRETSGMVFQNPDNQIIGQVVEEDVGFGPENIGMPTKEIWERVEESLKTVGMWEYRKHSPNKLSGGQKQRVSIAGVIAMHPKCIVFDEPTAMLDPSGRREVIRAARALNDVEKITIILITHYMDKGRVVLSGTPKEVFAKGDELKGLKLDLPQVTALGDELIKRGFDIPRGILTLEELTDAIMAIREGN